METTHIDTGDSRVVLRVCIREGENLAKKQAPEFGPSRPIFLLPYILLIFNYLYVQLASIWRAILRITRAMAARTGVEPVHQP
jgi:hypothetical protein